MLNVTTVSGDSSNAFIAEVVKQQSEEFTRREESEESQENAGRLTDCAS